MPVAQLEQPEMPADGIECFMWFNRHAGHKPRRNWPRLGPAFEMGISKVQLGCLLDRPFAD